MKLLMTVFVGALVAALSTGCANGYRDFYTQQPGATPELVSALRVAPPTGSPVVERSQPADPNEVSDAYARRGYVIVGWSMFNSGRKEPESDAIRQAVSVGADLVLILNPTYTGSVTSSIPITVPTTTTTYSSGTATVYGTGGTATASGTGTSTTYGTATTYVPMTVNRSDFGAVYFVKRRFILGAISRDLSDEERQRSQTNKGAVVSVIVDESPAFNADILVGDMIVAVDGQAVSNSAGLGELLLQRAGGIAEISILRRGVEVKKSVRLNSN